MECHRYRNTASFQIKLRDVVDCVWSNSDASHGTLCLLLQHYRWHGSLATGSARSNARGQEVVGRLPVVYTERCPLHKFVI